MEKQSVLNDKGRRWLIEVRESIINKPKQFNWLDFFMGQGGDLDFEFRTENEIAEILGKERDWCGTSCCVAGLLISHAINEEIGPTCTLDEGVDILTKRYKVNINRNTYSDISLVLILAPDALTDDYSIMFSEFLFYPWEFTDKNGNSMGEQIVDSHPTLSANEAVNRINWLLDDNPISEYEVSEDLWCYDEDDEYDY